MMSLGARSILLILLNNMCPTFAAWDPNSGWIVGPHLLETSTSTKTYAVAKADCESKNAWLVEIKTPEIQERLMTYLISLNRNAWFGAAYEGVEWKWNDGTRIGFNKWENGVGPASTLCAIAWRSTKLWRGYSCNKARHYICQSDLNNVLFYGNLEFYFDHTTTRNYENGKATCEARGSKLVDIKTAELNDELNTELNARGREHHYLTGATDIDTEGTWKWGDGTPLASGFQQWARNGAEPDGDIKQNCSTKNSDHEWEWVDVACTQVAFHLICQKNVSSGTCSADICSSNGTCAVSGSRYVCSCNKRYGSKCEIDPCEPNPCENGGTCSFNNTFPHYSCACTPSYDGLNCRDRAFKTDGHCKYHINLRDSRNYRDFEAVCQNLSGSSAMVKSEQTHTFLKTQITNMFGRDREVSFWMGGTKSGEHWIYPDGSYIPSSGGITKWAPNESSNSGNRLMMESLESSWSDLYWFSQDESTEAGYICEVKVSDPCVSNPCQNGGVCGAVGCHWKCRCTNGYSGFQCETDLLQVHMLQTIVYGIVGENITINLNIQTEVGNVRLQVFKGDEGSPIAETFSGDGNVGFDIGRITQTSNGEIYKIKATNLSSTVERFVNFTLIIQARAKITGVEPVKLAVPSSGPFQIACQTSGFPIPNNTWFKAGQVVSSDQNLNGPFQTSSGTTSTLYLQHADDSHVGVYTCKAVNSIGQQSTEIVDTSDVTVIGTPRFTAFGNCLPKIVVEWKPGPEAINYTHKIEVIRDHGGDATIRNVTSSSGNDITTEIENLKPSSNYTVKVSVCLGNYCFHRPHSDQHVRTGRHLPDVVNDANVTERRENKSCILSWSIPTPVVSITGFKIGLKSTNIHATSKQRGEENFNETFTLSRRDSNYHVSTKPNRNYTFTIQLRTCAGYGSIIKLSGQCTSDRGPPGVIPMPAIGQKGDSDETRSITIGAIDESNGAISCLFLIVERIASGEKLNGVTESDFSRTDLAEAHKNSRAETSADGMKYIAVARSKVSENMTFLLGDGSTSTCDVTAGSSRRRKRSTTSFEGKNFPLERGKEYRYFIVVTTPADNDVVYFSRSSDSSFKNAEKVPENGWLVPVVVVVVVLIVVVAIVLIVLYCRRRKNSTLKENDDLTMTTMDQPNGLTMLFQCIHSFTLKSEPSLRTRFRKKK